MLDARLIYYAVTQFFHPIPVFTPLIKVDSLYHGHPLPRILSFSNKVSGPLRVRDRESQLYVQ